MAHSHHHGHAGGPKNTPIRVLYLCLVLNLLFVAAEAWAGWRSNSTGLLSDAGHNLADVLGLLLSLIAIYMERAKGRINKKLSKYVTLTNGLLLIGAVSLIIFESIEKIVNPQQVHAETVIIVSVAAIVVNGFTAWLLMRGEKNDINIKAAYLHAASDMLVSVAVVISGIIISFTGWNIIDPALSLLVSFFIAVPALKLVIAALKNIIK